MKRIKPSFLHARENSVDRMRRPCPNSRVNLTEAYNDDSVWSTTSNENQPPNNEETVAVYLRLRPNPSLNPIRNPFKIKDNVLVAKCLDESGSTNKDFTEKRFTFSEIYDGHESQMFIFDHCIRPNLNDVLNDQGATFLTYGTSGSGKTYTLMGDSEQPGIIPRTIEQIFTENAANISDNPGMKIERSHVRLLSDDDIIDEFRKRDSIKACVGSSNHVYRKTRKMIQSQHDFEPKSNKNAIAFVWISMVEIYNELVHDLLSLDSFCTKKENLKVLSNDGNAYIKDLTSVFAKSSEDAYDILQYGIRGASYGSTDINLNSSRSHTIFLITVINYEPHLQVANHATYKFCDLAGSERLKKTGNQGSRIKETQKINTSLLVLGRCLETVQKNQKLKKNINDLVPVRDSKLTLLLQSALLGKEKLTMIVNLYPTDEYFEENINVLNFSSIAKEIHIQKLAVKPKGRATRYSLFLAQATSSPSSSDREKVALHNEVVSLKTALEIEREVNQRHEDELAQLLETIENKDDEIYKLRCEMIKQECALRNELCDDFDKFMKEREESLKLRCNQAKEAEIKIFKVRLQNLEEKLEWYKEDIEEYELEIESNSVELSACRSQLEKYKQEDEKRGRLRRLSV